MKLSKITAVLVVAATALVALPASASAAESCVFQFDKATDANQERLENSLLCLVNVYRLRSGLAALPKDTRLAAAARGHSDDMFNRNFFDHTNPDGAGPGTRAMAAGYPGGAGENIAMNIEGHVFKLFDQWRNSPGHNQNMLSSFYRAAGFGVRRGCCPQGPEGAIGTQKFGLAPANTVYTGLDLYANNEACAKAKTKAILGKERLKKKKGDAKSRLKSEIRNARKRAARICKPPV